MSFDTYIYLCKLSPQLRYKTLHHPESSPYEPFQAIFTLAPSPDNLSF